MNIEESIEILESYKESLEEYEDNPRIIQAIETLLTAYEKEKEIVDKINKLNIPVDTLIAEFERLEDLEDDLTTVYLNGVYDGEKKVEDKIKAKIEEYKKQQKEEPDAYLCIKVLSSLLEKE